MASPSFNQLLVEAVFEEIGPVPTQSFLFLFNLFSLSPMHNYSITLKYNCIFVARLCSFLGVSITLQLNGFERLTQERCKKSVSIRLDTFIK